MMQILRLAQTWKHWHLEQRVRVAVGLLPGLGEKLPDVGRIEKQERGHHRLAGFEHANAARSGRARPSVRGGHGRARSKGAGCRQAESRRS